MLIHSVACAFAAVKRKIRETFCYENKNMLAEFIIFFIVGVAMIAANYLAGKDSFLYPVLGVIGATIALGSLFVVWLDS